MRICWWAASSRLEIGGPNVLDIHNWYLGSYGQDSWRLSNRVTVNAGLRWEPYFGQYVYNNAIVIFNKAELRPGHHEQGVPQCAAGTDLSGRCGVPDGKTGLNIQWSNLVAARRRRVGR